MNIVAEQRLLTNTNWDGYVAIREALKESQVRLTFDRGRLELVTLSRKHERILGTLRCLLETMLLETNTSCELGGSMTFQRSDMERGLEPDACYWIANSKALAGRDDYIPMQDPPPDLVLEVDVSSSSLDRMAMFGSMGVPEVWRYADSQGLSFYRLTESGSYAQCEHSPAFPFLSSALLAQFIALREAKDTIAVIREFKAWLAKK